MTTVITRFFDSTAQALEVKRELRLLHQVSPRIMEIFDRPGTLVDALTAESVPADTARAYQARMASGGAVLVVRAGYKPLGVAKITRKTTALMGAVDMGGLTEEVDIKDVRKPLLSVLDDHPLMLSPRRDPDSTSYHMADWPIPLIRRRKHAPDTLWTGNPTLTGWFFPLKDDRKPYTGSIFAPHARMADWPLPLLSDRKPYTGSIVGRHARMANFPLPLISRRQPRNRTIIGRHTRMANWPFPLLINGETGTNALMPGGPRMANWPISLLSRRRPFDRSIFGRHARMASFPIPLISRRKPFTGSLIAPHAHMADAILPLVIPHGEEPSRGRNEGFSFSKWLGIPTLTRR